MCILCSSVAILAQASAHLPRPYRPLDIPDVDHPAAEEAQAREHRRPGRKAEPASHAAQESRHEEAHRRHAEAATGSPLWSHSPPRRHGLRRPWGCIDQATDTSLDTEPLEASSLAGSSGSLGW
eukprot:6277154-Heterocapsa_arctica.AAC.1